MTDLVKSIFGHNSLFIAKCRLASYGLNVLPGRLVCSNGAWFDHEFDSDCVRLKNHEGREMVILFSNLFRYEPSDIKDGGEIV